MRVNKTKLKSVAQEKGFKVEFEEKQIVLKPEKKDTSADLLMKFSELMTQNQTILEALNRPDVDLTPLLKQFKHLIAQNNAILVKMNEKPIFEDKPDAPDEKKEWRVEVERDVMSEKIESFRMIEV